MEPVEPAGLRALPFPTEDAASAWTNPRGTPPGPRHAGGRGSLRAKDNLQKIGSAKPDLAARPKDLAVRPRDLAY